jgi:hypothetical protein
VIEFDKKANSWGGLNLKQKGVEMSKFKWILIASLVIMLLAVPMFGACGEEEVTPPPPSDGGEPPPVEYTLYIGGSFPLTGPYPEDGAAVLAAFQDYAAYVNETHKLAPWRTETFPENVTLEVKCLDDEANPEKALTSYEMLKADGLLVYRISGSGIAQAIMARLQEDNVGATTMASGPYLLAPPKTIFMNYPIYTDQVAGIADWFMENWTEDRAPRVSYFTNDSFGRTIMIPEMDAYLESIGYEMVSPGQIISTVPTAPPTTALLWLKENNVDLTLGAMLTAGSEPSLLEADRLGMGPDLDYEITFGFASPAHLVVYVRDMGAQGDGCVVAGSYPPWDDPCDGMVFCNYIQETYRPDDRVTHIMYPHGIVEAMIQVEALRLALENTGKSADQLTSADVLNYGFYMINNLDTGGIIPTPMTFGPTDVEGADAVRVDQAQNGEVVLLGTWPLRHIYTQE